MRYEWRLLVFACVVWNAAVPAHAQDSGARVSGVFAGTFGEGSTNLQTGGSVGYRFTPHVGFDFETLVIPDLELNDSGIGDGRAVAFLANVVAELPANRWLIPYVEGGGGVANVSQSAFVFFLPASERGRGIGDRGRTLPGPLGLLPEIGIDRLSRRRSETDLALTIGGGVDFRIWRGLAVGPNISYLRLFGNLQDLNLTRIGGRASYRF